MKTATEWPLASRRHTAGNRLVDIRIPGRFASRRCPDRALGGLGDRKSSVNSSRRRSMSFFLNPSKLDDSGMGITEYSPEFGLGSKSWKAVQLRECPFGFHIDPHCTTFPMPLAVSSHLAPDDYDSQPRKFTHRKTGRGQKGLPVFLWVKERHFIGRRAPSPEPSTPHSPFSNVVNVMDMG